MARSNPVVPRCDFTYVHYRELLERLKATGARFHRFGEDEAQAYPAVWLRHDVDLDPAATLPLAEAEAEAGATAAYLFQVTSPLYNPLAPATAGVIRRLQALGHEVGLHLNLHSYDPGAGPAAVLARREAEVLEKVAGAPVRLLSFHRPSPEWLGRAVEGFVSTYEPAYFTASRYLSDSGMRWREGCACRHAGAHPRLQILTHGEWWAEQPGDREERLARFRRLHRGRWEAEVAAEVAPPPHPPRKEGSA